jgi:phage/plasmid-like protein (TIGR03299 family)
MAHNVQSMMYAGDTPWHRLGTQLEGPATAEEAIKAAKLDWKVVKKPLYAYGGDHLHRVPDKFAVVKEDLWGKPECPVFGIVGKEYTPLQNRDAFAWFDPIVQQQDAAINHTAGALGEGERIWILAKLPSYIEVAEGDITDKYLLLSNSHDGNSSVQIKFTPIRVVCQNTLTMALQNGPTIRVPHYRDLPDRLRAAEKALKLIDTRYNQIEETFRAMVSIKMTGERLPEYLSEVFPFPRDPENASARERVLRDRQAATKLFASGRGNQEANVAGSLWTAYNGVTEYIDHDRGTRRSDERHLESIWFGEGYHIKARAFRVAESKLRDWSAG